MPWDAWFSYKPFRPFAEWPAEPSAKAWRGLERFLGMTPIVTLEDARSALGAVADIIATERVARAARHGEVHDRGDRLVASLIAGFTQAFEFAIAREPMREAWIRQLHATTCEGQESQP
jgi:hypothetical protein